MSYSTSISVSVEALQKAQETLRGITRDYSLDRIDRDLLNCADNDPSKDEGLETLLELFRGSLASIKGPDDVISFSQVFEVYGEIKTYHHLKHHGCSPKLVPTVKNEKRPDFECSTPWGKKFYVEVKSFDVANGKFALSDYQEDGITAAISIEDQQRRGTQISISEQEITPYGKVARGASQVKTVIETIASKVENNFKPGQFNLGPTFAVMVLDKLIVPGRQCALSPYYHEEICEGSACISGTLWASAYAESGYLLLDLFEFEGKPTNSGCWSRSGYFTKRGNHTAQGIIFFDQALSNPLVYGLKNSNAPEYESWDSDDSMGVLDLLCDAQNCEDNSYGYDLACYDARVDFPINSTSKCSWVFEGQ